MSAGPSTENELMLFRVLDRANLTQYYDAFISQGGDDLYQLCEAGEEEFLEIMVLVGMSQKPLHVRRLQKVLHEWASNPASFRENDGKKVQVTTGQTGAVARGSILAAFLQHSSPSSSSVSKPSSMVAGLPLPGGHDLDRPVVLLTTNGHALSSGNTYPQEHSFRALQIHLESNSDGFVDKPSSPVSETSDQDSSLMAFMNSSGEKGSTSPSSGGVQLLDAHVKKIEKTTAEMANSLPYYAPKPLNMKKAIDKEIDEAMNLAEDDPNRMDLFRRYSAIYGRFDSKRRGGKLMNFHERCINEAAAQLCKHRPSLLTRREELFILARQVIREAGFQYSKGFRSKESIANSLANDEPPTKMMKTDAGTSQVVQDLSFSKHRYLQPGSASLGGQHNEADHEVEMSHNGDLVQDYSVTGNSASDSFQRGTSLPKNGIERNLLKAQPSPSSRKVHSFRRESRRGENGGQEEVDEQKEWQREVGLDSLKIASSLQSKESSSVQGTSIQAQGSSIIQALREGMRGTRSNKANTVIKQEVCNE